MGTVIEPWVLTARRETLRAAQEGQEEVEAWRRHRERQRRPVVLSKPVARFTTPSARDPGT